MIATSNEMERLQKLPTLSKEISSPRKQPADAPIRSKSGPSPTSNKRRSPLVIDTKDDRESERNDGDANRVGTPTQTLSPTTAALSKLITTYAAKRVTNNASCRIKLRRRSLALSNSLTQSMESLRQSPGQISLSIRRMRQQQEVCLIRENLHGLARLCSSNRQARSICSIVLCQTKLRTVTTVMESDVNLQQQSFQNYK
ncbi:hypothetical protein QTG54_000382 [Skeletonema marinoi]|uniref:Uncharacterized protein n=1 Tax=Skeletonema marinoi TaxID=267567 RepID=A0AAD8YM06_9STRA|nr:hypothetical protein QTG54_000382 [Skeletonema marinoi]